jgi:hypothetical protein
LPVAVYNNVEGGDRVTLQKFNEPTWNNPVLRFMNSDGNELIARKDGDYSYRFVLLRSIAALEKAKKPIPKYLKLAAEEVVSEKMETAVFAMYCYWEGEAKLGSLDGVVGTSIGELGGHEVVEVKYNPEKVDYQSLVKHAIKMDCTHQVYARSEAQLKIARELVGNKAQVSQKAIDSRTQQQYHLFHYPQYYFLPLTAIQATKVNYLLANKKLPDELLSPSQLEMKKKIESMNPEQLKKMATALKPGRSESGIGKYASEIGKLLGE